MNEIITRIIREGDRHVVEIPKEFGPANSEVIVRQDGDALIIEPVNHDEAAPRTWAEFFDNLEPVEVDWPDVDEGLLPLDDIDLE